MDLKTLDTIFMAIGVAYGVALIASAFARNRILDGLRIDTMIMRNPSPVLRYINIPAGGFMIGYGIYTLFLKP
jgi:hypothetical protein